MLQKAHRRIQNLIKHLRCKVLIFCQTLYLKRLTALLEVGPYFDGYHFSCLFKCSSNLPSFFFKFRAKWFFKISPLCKDYQIKESRLNRDSNRQFKVWNVRSIPKNKHFVLFYFLRNQPRGVFRTKEGICYGVSLEKYLTAFYCPWKHQKTKGSWAFFRGYGISALYER